MSAEAVAVHIEKIERDWDAVESNSLTGKLLSSRVSRWLQQQRATRSCDEKRKSNCRIFRYRLKRSYSRLGWPILTSQDEAEALASLVGDGH